MRVLLVGAELEENLATRYLAASLERAGHQVCLAPFGDKADADRVAELVRCQTPGLVGLSMTFQRRAHEFGALANTLRAQGFSGHITCGGHFPTFAWKALLQRYPSIDTAVRHEGEHAIVELCEALGAASPAAAFPSLAGLAWRTDDATVQANPARALHLDLDSLPFPKRTGDPQVHLGIPTAFLVGSRGCYGHCAFCCIHAYIADAGGPKYRARSTDNIADEIAELRSKRGARMFVFHDDDFFTRDHARDLARVRSLRDSLRRRGVRDIALVVKARPDDVDTEVFGVLQEIGLLRIYLGIEAGCTQGLKTLGRSVDLETNRRSLAVMREMNVYTCYNMLIFDPDSTPASLRASLDFWEQYAEIPMNFCRTEVYVGTPLMRRLAREGRLIGDEFGWDYEISNPAAERTLRVFARAFMDRNFRANGLMNTNLGLGYHLQLLKQFYPYGFSPALREDTLDVLRSVNLDCISRMRRIVDFCDSPAGSNPDALEEFTCRLTEETEAANEQLEERVNAGTARIMAAARERRTQGAPLWKSVAAATLALTPLACPSQQVNYPPPDPVPPPDPPPPPTGVLVVEDAGGPYSQPPPDYTNYPPPDPPPPPTGYPRPTAIPPMDPPPPPDPLPPPRLDGGTRPRPRPHPTHRPPPPPPPDPLPYPHQTPTDPDKPFNH
ncbi:MAG: cobalamin B12-binding domain-containing protein [Deltaproteobacteria bacterium]|nr:cobalamin B12-binding domain-containing protein [Deltaproteobacteria bacterium]